MIKSIKALWQYISENILHSEGGLAMKTMSEQMETLEKKTVESTYIQQATSNTYQLQKEKIYIVAISSIIERKRNKTEHVQKRKLSR